MLRRIITRLKKNFRLPVVMSEPVQAVQEKREDNDISEDNKAKKQKGVQEKRSGEEICDDNKAKKQKGIHEGLSDRKRKVALLIAYNGKGYYGLQRQQNQGFKSIEEELCTALLNVGVIPQGHYDSMQKMLLNVENLLEKINAELPPAIRVMGCKRTVNSFNSKNFCDARTYIYLVPTLAFAPVEQVVNYSYRTSPEIIEHVNKVLKKYLGTHPFHNFTSGIKADEKSCRRYIKYIECGEPFIRNNTEFAVISVLGQSFMLHQIRKMIGLCIAVVKGYCGEEIVDRAWNPERVDIPKAPGLGLVLEKPHYDGYNKRYGNDGQHEALDWSNIQDKLDKFKEEQIFSEIIKTEIAESSMINWCGSLHKHSYEENPTRWFPADRAREKLSRLASDQSGSSDSENATANQTEDDRVSANQNEDDRLSLSNQNSDNRSDTISGTETVKTDATTETTGTCQELETDRRGSVSEGTLEGRSSNECKESKDENMENEESVRQIKQAGKIS